MFPRLLILFTVIPLIELFVLMKVGAAIGLFNTILLVIVTAMAGAYLAKRQGIETLSRIRQQLSMGALPADELIDGALILVAGLLLITPGLITDTFGFSLLIPYTRQKIRDMLKRFFNDLMGRGGGVWMRRE
ncbi:MAG: FxsA family protein [Chitinispirillaceae bacterium]|nr:FxsA family protein [Chitinispirillaceae bacterium]